MIIFDENAIVILQPLSSPDNEDNRLHNRVLDSPLDLARCRSFFKEEFVLEESRPKELHSASDPTSSYSGSSLSSSSPRDILGGTMPLSSTSAVLTQPSSSRSLRLDPGLETLLEQSASQEGMQRSGSATVPTSKIHGASCSTDNREANTTGAMNFTYYDLKDNGEKHKTSPRDNPAMPIIRTHRRLQQQHHQRVRRRSEHSLSSSVESEHGFTLLQNKPKHQPLGRAGSLKLADRWRHHSSAGLVADDSDLPEGSVNVHKSQSLDSISPRVQKGKELCHTTSGDNLCKSQRQSADTSKIDENINESTNLATKKEISGVEHDVSSSQVLPSMFYSEKTVNDKDQSVSTTIEPFSGKIKMMASTEFDNWDSYPSLEDETGDSKSSSARKVLETRSSKSKSSQRQRQSNSSMVSKSCSNVGDNLRNGAEVLVDSIRPQTVLDCNLPSDDQNIFERSLSFDQGLNNSARSTIQDVNGSARRGNISSHQAFEDSLRQSAGSPLAKKVNSTRPGPNRLFIVSEESVRKSSASKQKAEERAAATQIAQAKFREAAGVMTSQKTKTETEQKPQAVDSKVKTASKASFIEKNLMRNPRNVATAAKSRSAQTYKTDQNKAGSASKSGQTSSEMKQENKARVSSFGGKLAAATSASSKRASATTVIGNTNAIVTPRAIIKDASIENNKAMHSGTNKENKSSVTNATASVKLAMASLQNNTKKVDEKPLCKQSVKDSETCKEPNLVTPNRSAMESPVKITFTEASSQPNNPSTAQHTNRKPQTPLQTPVIVNPFENFVNKYVKANENATKDAVVKMKKTTHRAGKKSSVSSTPKARPNSCSTRTSSAGKKRGSKVKTGDADYRPKSGKKLSRRKSKQPHLTTESELSQDAKNPNTALISGIGWQLSTACVDSSNVQVTKDPKYNLTDSDLDNDFSVNADNDDENDFDDAYEDDDDDISEYAASEKGQQKERSSFDCKTNFVLESARDNTSIDTERRKNLLEVDQRLREAFKEKVIEHSPRFLEMKWRQETQTELHLPLAEDDGFPPMNLDVTHNLHAPQQKSDGGRNQNKSNQDQFQIESHYLLPEQTDMREKIERYDVQKTDDFQQEIFQGKLTPIPEGPSVLSRTENAISEFDKEMKGSKLSLLLDGGSDNSLDIHNDHREISRPTRNKSANSGSSKEAAKRSAQIKGSLMNNQRLQKPKNDNSNKYEYTPSGKAVRKRKSDLDLGAKFSEVENPIKNDKNNNNNEEDLKDAIEEILSSTTSSLASTLKNLNCDEDNHSVTSPGFGCHSLTDGDKSLLLRMRNCNYSSPFHAKSHKNYSSNFGEDDFDLPLSPTEADDQSIPSMSATFPRNKSSFSSPYKSSTSGAQIHSKFDQVVQESVPGTKKDSDVKILTSSPSQSSFTSKSAGKTMPSVRSSLQDEHHSPNRQRLTRSTSTREIRKREVRANLISIPICFISTLYNTKKKC